MCSRSRRRLRFEVVLKIYRAFWFEFYLLSCLVSETPFWRAIVAVHTAPNAEDRTLKMPQLVELYLRFTVQSTDTPFRPPPPKA